MIILTLFQDETNLLDVSILKEQRLPRYLMKLDKQQEWESQRLWIKVSEAIQNEDQVCTGSTSCGHLKLGESN